MKDFIKSVAISSGALIGVLGACYAGLYSLFDGLPTSKVVAIVEIVIVVGIVAALLVIFVVRLLWRTRQSTPARWERDFSDVVDGVSSPVEASGYRPPQPQLSAPRVITVPRYAVSGVAQPFNMPAQSIPVLRTVTDDAELTVPLNYLQRFLGLRTPARSEWVGKREMYSACLAFAEAHGLLQRDARGGASWLQAYPLDARIKWAGQFDPHPTAVDDADPVSIWQR